MIATTPCKHPYNLDGDSGDYPCQCHASTTLDTIDTSGHHDLPLSQIYRHSGWASTRRKVYHALLDLSIGLPRTNQHVEPGTSWLRDDPAVSLSRLRAYVDCGSLCYVLQSKDDPTIIKLAASCCHDRFCLPCASGRAQTMAANVTQYLSDTPCRFVTLTLRHNDHTLSSQIDRLYRSFKRLRRSPFWQKTQKGGVAFLEIKRSRDRQSWHPHLHLISQGRYLDARQLSRTWHDITGDSHVVDVRLVRDQRKVVTYITKYASKPFDRSLFDDHNTLCEAIVALTGRRMALTYGNWIGLQMTDKPDADAWDYLDTLEGLCYRAACGDAHASAIVVAACGDRAAELIALAGQRSPPRLDLDRPPTPDPQLYLLDYSPQDYYCDS